MDKVSSVIDLKVGDERGVGPTDRILSPCSRPSGFELPDCQPYLPLSPKFRCCRVQVNGWGRTRQFIVQILVVFVAVAVGGDVSAGFGVAHILHLMGVLFDTDLAKVAQGAHYRRHLCGLEDEV